MNGTKTRTEFFTEQKIKEIQQKDKKAKIYVNEYDTDKRKFSSAEAARMVDTIKKKSQEWRKEHPGFSDTRIRTWLCGTAKDSPLKNTELAKDISDFRDSMPHVFADFTDRVKCTPILEKDFKYMLYVRQLQEKGELDETEGMEAFNEMAQKRHLRADVTVKDMQKIHEEREKEREEKFKAEQEELKQILQEDGPLAEPPCLCPH